MPELKLFISLPLKYKEHKHEEQYKWEPWCYADDVLVKIKSIDTSTAFSFPALHLLPIFLQLVIILFVVTILLSPYYLFYCTIPSI